MRSILTTRKLLQGDPPLALFGKILGIDLVLLIPLIPNYCLLILPQRKL